MIVTAASSVGLNMDTRDSRKMSTRSLLMALARRASNQAGRPGKAEELHYGYDEEHGGNAEQPIARRADREAAADANEEQDGGQEDREAHVLVRGSGG